MNDIEKRLLQLLNDSKRMKRAIAKIKEELEKCGSGTEWVKGYRSGLKLTLKWLEGKE